MGRLDGQLDQKLMHTPRAHCEILAIFLADPDVLLFDRSTMKDMAPLNGYQPEQALLKEEYKYLKGAAYLSEIWRDHFMLHF